VEELIGKLQIWLGRGPAPAPPLAAPAVASDLRRQLETFSREMREEGAPGEEIDGLMADFLQAVPPLLTQVEQAIQAHNRSAACFAAHKVKGSFLALGLTDLGNATASLELDCGNSDWSGAARHFARAAALFHEVQRLISESILAGAKVE